MSPVRALAPFAGILAALSLAACGSDGGDVLTLTGSQAPVESPADQRTRGPGILARADSLILTTMVGETTVPGFPTFEIVTDCDGTRCSWREPRTGFSGVIDLGNLASTSGEAQSVLTKNGITPVKSRAPGIEAYGAWMSHAGFAVQSQRNTVESYVVTTRYGIAGGDLTGVAPPLAATWRGLMVGTPREGALSGDALQGDAALIYELSAAGGSLDAAFTDIKNIDRGVAHSVTSVRFDDVPVDAGGAYRMGGPGNLIQGGFYGPGHVEAAGVFEQQGIVGAFGAKLAE